MQLRGLVRTWGRYALAAVESSYPAMLAQQAKLRTDGVPEDVAELGARLEAQWGKQSRSAQPTVEKIASKLAAGHYSKTSASLEQSLGVNVMAQEPWLQSSLSAYGRENAKLIGSIGQQAADNIERLVQTAVVNGTSMKELRDQIQNQIQSSEKRAALIARDQVGKLNGHLTRLRHEGAGIDSYRWRGSLDRRERKEHVVREGKQFAYVSPPPDGNPGEPIQCRCSAEPVMDEFDDLLAEAKMPAKPYGPTTKPEPLKGVVPPQDVPNPWTPKPVKTWAQKEAEAAAILAEQEAAAAQLAAEELFAAQEAAAQKALLEYEAKLAAEKVSQELAAAELKAAKALSDLREANLKLVEYEALKEAQALKLAAEALAAQEAQAAQLAAEAFATQEELAAAEFAASQNAGWARNKFANEQNEIAFQEKKAAELAAKHEAELLALKQKQAAEALITQEQLAAAEQTAAQNAALARARSWSDPKALQFEEKSGTELLKSTDKIVDFKDSKAILDAWAKDKYHGDKLTPGQKKAVVAYQQPADYKAINSGLRGNNNLGLNKNGYQSGAAATPTELVAHHAKTIKDLDAVLHANLNTEAFLTYRGFHGKAVIDKMKAALDNNGIFVDKAYVSTSPMSKIVEKYSKSSSASAKAIMEIRVPPGTPNYYMNAAGAVVAQDAEILLGRDLQYRILSHKVVDGIDRFVCEVIPPGTRAPKSIEAYLGQAEPAPKVASIKPAADPSKFAPNKKIGQSGKTYGEYEAMSASEKKTFEAGLAVSAKKNIEEYKAAQPQKSVEFPVSAQAPKPNAVVSFNVVGEGSESHKAASVWAHSEFADQIANRTKEEVKAVASYQGANYTYVNQYLRTGKPFEGFGHTKEKWDTIVERVDELIQRHELSVDTKVYRGIKGFDAAVGETVSDLAYTSTSLSSEVAESFAGKHGVVAEIVLPKGTKAAFVQPYTDAELEILLERGVRFKVLARWEENGVQRVKLEVLDGLESPLVNLQATAPAPKPVVEPVPAPTHILAPTPAPQLTAATPPTALEKSIFLKKNVPGTEIPLHKWLSMENNQQVSATSGLTAKEWDKLSKMKEKLVEYGIAEKDPTGSKWSYKQAAGEAPAPITKKLHTLEEYSALPGAEKVAYLKTLSEAEKAELQAQQAAAWQTQLAKEAPAPTPAVVAPAPAPAPAAPPTPAIDPLAAFKPTKKIGQSGKTWGEYEAMGPQEKATFEAGLAVSAKKNVQEYKALKGAAAPTPLPTPKPQPNWTPPPIEAPKNASMYAEFMAAGKEGGMGWTAFAKELTPADAKSLIAELEAAGEFVPSALKKALVAPAPVEVTPSKSMFGDWMAAGKEGGVGWKAFSKTLTPEQAKSLIEELNAAGEFVPAALNNAATAEPVKIPTFGPDNLTLEQITKLPWAEKNTYYTKITPEGLAEIKALKAAYNAAQTSSLVLAPGITAKSVVQSGAKKYVFGPDSTGGLSAQHYGMSKVQIAAQPKEWQEEFVKAIAEAGDPDEAAVLATALKLKYDPFAEKKAAAEAAAKVTLAKIGEAKGKKLLTPYELDSWARGKYKKWEDHTAGEKAALKSYQGSGYGPMNDQLRDVLSGKLAAVKPAEKTKVNNLDKAMKANPLAEDIVVYRGVKNREFKKELLSKIGQTFTDGGYGSSSPNESVGIGWSNHNLVMEIELPKGMPSVHFNTFGSHSVYKNEQEILIPRGATYELLGHYEKGGITYLRMRLVDHALK